MSEPRRLVVVAMGFGIWNGGRHELSARWSDVARVAAVQPGSGPDAPRRPALVVTLADGREIALDPALAGWDAFVAAAPGMLAGMPSAPAWPHVLAQGAANRAANGAATVLLYERRAPHR